MIRGGKVSCREAVAAALARLDAINPRINAVVRPLHEQALAEAAAADEALARGARVGPLHGVPVTTKVNVDQTGCPTDNGVVAFKSVMATRDNPVVANLRRAGGIVIGRTNTPAFSMRWFTDNALHGLTRNPWDPGRTPGGSSGGGAAATDTGIGAIARGNDIAGSVRYPAYCCGLVGLRVSYGRIPSHNFTATALRPISAQLMAVQGRSPGGCATPGWPSRRWRSPIPSTRAAPTCRSRARPRSGRSGSRSLRIRRAAAASSRPSPTRCAGPGARWRPRATRWRRWSRPSLGAVADLWAAIAMDDTIAALEPAAAQYGDEGIKRALALWRAIYPARDTRHVLEGLAQRDRLLRLWELFLEERPIVVTPVSNERAFPLDLDLVDVETTRRIMGAQIMQLAVPVLGLPAVSVPTGAVDGVPMGVQITAGRYREDLCLDAAAAIEARAPMATPIDPVSR
jgi:amidase